MSGEASDPVRRSQETRRRRDLAFLLPCLGVFLFLSPIISVFNKEASIGGLPVIFVFVYGAWAGLILAARSLAPRLRSEPPETAGSAE